MLTGKLAGRPQNLRPCFYIAPLINVPPVPPGNYKTNKQYILEKVFETKSSLFHAVINLLFMQIIQKMPRNTTFNRTTNVGPKRASRPYLIK